MTSLTDESVSLKARIERLEAALRPFAKAANHGEEISTVFRDGGYDSMSCRDAFMWQAMKPLCVRDFLDARAALTALERGQS